ncbi:MAG: signal peptidase I [Bacteroidia bacterium]
MGWIIIIILFYIILPGVANYRVFQKAGKQGWESFVPFYSDFVWLQVIDKPRWWVIFAFIPGLSYLLLVIMAVETYKCFGKFKFWQHVLAFLPVVNYIYLFYLGMSKDEKFYGPDYAQSNYKRTASREWADAILFAIVAATVIRSFFIEAYTIPTPSMEETLLVDDYLFVSKLNYGPRIPLTPLSFPLAHNTMPVTGGKSYLDWPSIPYYRLPGWEKIKNNDIVVFNWPAEELGRPIDKTDNYIKRCIAIPGDTLQIIDREVYLNGKKTAFPEFSQFLYQVGLSGNSFIQRSELHGLGITGDDMKGPLGTDPKTGYSIYQAALTQHAANELKKHENVKQVEPLILPKGYFQQDVFHQYASLPWNVDNFGPLYVPKKGATIPMSLKNYYLYQKAIRDYEKNPGLSLKDSVVYLNDQPLKEYTFKMDYYFMMGDNRHNSSDGRMWGFVPEDHIVGKPVMIWFSTDREGKGFGKIRWNRLFRIIN